MGEETKAEKIKQYHTMRLWGGFNKAASFLPNLLPPFFG
jgi:hypothetical protein